MNELHEALILHCGVKCKPMIGNMSSTFCNLGLHNVSLCISLLNVNNRLIVVSMLYVVIICPAI